MKKTSEKKKPPEEHGKWENVCVPWCVQVEIQVDDKKGEYGTRAICLHTWCTAVRLWNCALEEEIWHKQRYTRQAIRFGLHRMAEPTR